MCSNIKIILLTSLKKFKKQCEGIAAIEFALLLPVMILVFFGMVEGSDALTVSRRLSNATNSIADLIGREPQISKGEVDDVMIGITRILEPTDTSSLVVNLVSVEVDPSDPNKLIVHWSRANNKTVPYPAGSQYTGVKDISTLKDPNTLIIVEVGYTYQSGLTNLVFDNPIDFEYSAKRWPRRSTRVQLCDNIENDGSYSGCTT